MNQRNCLELDLTHPVIFATCFSHLILMLTGRNIKGITAKFSEEVTARNLVVEGKLDRIGYENEAKSRAISLIGLVHLKIFILVMFSWDGCKRLPGSSLHSF